MLNIKIIQYTSWCLSCEWVADETSGNAIRISYTSNITGVEYTISLLYNT